MAKRKRPRAPKAQTVTVPVADVRDAVRALDSLEQLIELIKVIDRKIPIAVEWSLSCTNVSSIIVVARMRLAGSLPRSEA